MEDIKNQLDAVCSDFRLFEKVRMYISRNIVNIYESGVLESLLVNKDRKVEYVVSDDIKKHIVANAFNEGNWKLYASIQFENCNGKIVSYISSIIIRRIPNGEIILNIIKGDINNELGLNGVLDDEVIEKFKKNTIEKIHANQDSRVNLIMNKERSKIEKLKKMDKSFHTVEIQDSIDMTSEDGHALYYYVYYYKIVVAREEDHQSYLYIYTDKCMSDDNMVLSCKLDI
jgi:hypothetical protein